MRYLQRASVVLFIMIFYTPAMGEEKLARLLKQRSLLYKDYQYMETQNSSFWGTKSKKDLNNIIQTLKRIIAKDTEIIKEAKTRGTGEPSRLLVAESANKDQDFELVEENKRLSAILKKYTFDYNIARDELEELENSRSWFIKITIILGLTLGFTVFYILKLRQQFAKA